jgi:dihydroxyacetone kinase
MDASMFRAWIHEAARSVTENADHLTHLDSAVGDADHGINMRRGLQAAARCTPCVPPPAQSHNAVCPRWSGCCGSPAARN